MVKRKKNQKMMIMMNLEANRKVSGHEETKECRCEVDYGDESKPDDGDDHGSGDHGDGHHYLDNGDDDDGDDYNDDDDGNADGDHNDDDGDWCDLRYSPPVIDQHPTGRRHRANCNR